jgi:protocatechuate 3,4-dioxygenase alpha subunit
MTGSEIKLHESPSQTAGPYVHIGCLPIASGIEGVYSEDPGSRMINEATKGERIKIEGCVYDGEAVAVTDAIIEVWQADSMGNYPVEKPSNDTFSGWGRVACNQDSGEFEIETIRPGAVAFDEGRLQAPHITLWIVARGINVGLHTRLYFADEDLANANDPVLSQIDPASRAQTLIAENRGAGCYRFEIYLQGDRETVFFDI